MTDEAELVAMIEAAPDDPAGYLVYGDWLQTRGDPRGALIAIHNRQRIGREVNAVFARHGKALLGSLFRDHGVRLHWRWGFVERARAVARDEADALAIIDRVIASPACRFLRELELAGAIGWDRVEARLVELARPVTLRAIELGDHVPSPALFAAFPQLAPRQVRPIGEPARDDRDEAAALVAGVGDPAVAYDRLIAAQRIPAVPDLYVTRRFGPALDHAPPTVAAVIALAADPRGIARAETHAIEMIQAFFRTQAFRPDDEAQIVWELGAWDAVAIRRDLGATLDVVFANEAHCGTCDELRRPLAGTTELAAMTRALDALRAHAEPDGPYGLHGALAGLLVPLRTIISLGYFVRELRGASRRSIVMVAP